VSRDGIGGAVTGRAAGSDADSAPGTITLGLSTFLISLVVVGAALALASWVVLAEEPKPARKQPTRDRATRQPVRTSAPPVMAPAEPADKPTQWKRLRSGLLLAVLLTMLGVLAALFLVVTGFLVLNALRNAVQ
jgi:flagellar biosynthesis protein FliP